MYSTPACPPGFPGSGVVRVIDPAGAAPENISPVNNSVTAPFSGTLSETFAQLLGQFPAMRGNTTELAVYCFALAGGNGSAVAAQETFVTISADGATYAITNSPQTPTATTTTLAASPSPAPVGQTVTLTATEAPAAAGSVQFEDGGTSIGSPVAVNASGQATTTTTFASAGTRNLSAVFTPTNTTAYSGSTGTYSLTVVDANINISPATATNAVGANHVLPIIVNGVGGNIDAGPHTATASIVSGPGSFVGGNTCTYTGGGPTASCTVTITSPTTGDTVVSATSDIPVNGVTITRTTGTATNTASGGSGNASKSWVNANIQISPVTATNPIGANHVLTVTVNALNGTIDAGSHTATASILSGPGSFVGGNTCTYTGGAATASCTVTITSADVGTTVVQASSDVPVNGVVITRTTGTADNTAAGGSGNASKNWVSANIQIGPATATNAIDANHVLTITVNALNGTIDAGPHTATATILSGPGAFVGSNQCTYTGGAATASCTVTITSAVVGTTVVQASSDIPVNGVVITRTSGTAANTASGGSGNASKNWVDANIQIGPASATNAINANHVLTITVNALNGTIDAGPHTATAMILSGPGAFVGSNQCTYTGGAATASCTLTITSAVVGTTVVQASSDIPVGGVVITRTTGTAANTASGGSGDASKNWVDANINITPATATNPVGANHVLTITVNALGGTIDAGPHTVTASIVSGPGGFVGGNTCTYTGGAAIASCTVTITSAVVGTTAVQASSDIPVNGVVITRTTGTAANTASGGSGNAQKIWFLPSDANIQIGPASATNAIDTNHVLTITVNALHGTIDAGPHTATAMILSGPGAFVGSNQCTYTGGAATASCTVTITSAVVGTTVIQASSDIPVNGVVITRTTGTAANTAAGGSGDASKNWVDANINITPATANNPVGANHVLTITVNALGGTIDAGPHTVTASIVSGPGSFVGGNTCTYTGGAATASCTVTITAAATGTTVVSATSDIPVGGVTITRTTGTAENTASGGSGNAAKNWAASQVSTRVLDASNSDVSGSTTITPGTVVHDEATVTKTAATPAAVPAPTGTVTFTLFNGTGCTGAPASTDASEPLNATGVATSVTFTTPGAGGPFSYRAHYNGDVNYPQADGPCEQFTVKPDAAHQVQTLLTAVTGVAPGSSLAAKVKQIQGFVAANDKKDACAVLGAFLSQVKAQKGKQLTAAQAASFTAQAVSIEATLGC
jgi:hypothetical protein